MKRLLQLLSQPLRRGVALGLLLTMMLVVAMAASPRLHEWLHHDADHADHECAVTLFTSGSAADQATPAPLLADVALPCVEILRAEAAQEVFLARVEGRIQERAPPMSAA